MEPIVKIWQFPKKKKKSPRSGDIGTIFHKKSYVWFALDFLLSLSGKNSVKKQLLNDIVIVWHTKSTETNFQSSAAQCLTANPTWMSFFLQSHCLKEKNITHGIGCKEEDLTFSTGSLSKSHSKLIWPLNMPCMPVAFSKLLHTSKNSCTKASIMPTTVWTVVENSWIHVVSRVKLESLTCYIPTCIHTQALVQIGCAIQYLYWHQAKQKA
jgi:hypothetical protein